MRNIQVYAIKKDKFVLRADSGRLLIDNSEETKIIVNSAIPVNGEPSKMTLLP